MEIALNVQKFKHFLFLFLNKMLAIRVGIPKRLVGIGNREDPDQTASSAIRPKKKYVCLLFDENFKQGRSIDFLF